MNKLTQGRFTIKCPLTYCQKGSQIQRQLFNSTKTHHQVPFCKLSKWWQNSVTITQLQDKNGLSNTSLQLVKKLAKLNNNYSTPQHTPQHRLSPSNNLFANCQIGGQNQGDHIVILSIRYYCQTAQKLESATSQILQDWWFFWFSMNFLVPNSLELLFHKVFWSCPETMWPTCENLRW